MVEISSLGSRRPGKTRRFDRFIDIITAIGYIAFTNYLRNTGDRKKYQMHEIIGFATFEIKGTEGGQIQNGDAIKYLLKKVFIDFGAWVYVNNAGFMAA